MASRSNSNKSAHVTAETGSTALTITPPKIISTVTDAFPGAQSSKEEAIARYAVVIAAAWQKSVLSILEVCSSCAKADAELDLDGRRHLIAKLPFDRSTFVKLVAIGKSPALYARDLQQHLPPSWTILNTVRKLAPTELKRAIDVGAIGPNSSRADAIKWMSEPGNCKGAKALLNRKAKNLSAQASTDAKDPEQKSEDAKGPEQKSEDTKPDEKFRSLVDAWNGSPLAPLWQQASRGLRHRFMQEILKT